eukprot:gnl/MRDRNA2_/MRDRNA2_29085_c0_seq1.p1 gnl/MRDRNA2_/MRDRNA2_29085_c0~~gnl/MRDRNA2_/MRDRNA2_29085_c0_seq1.p1  ORF type:complete len:191 (-),score=33.31 gnl/MRDRNA2_/MRDRNA2_29085_c0_seq1:366-938(-)
MTMSCFGFLNLTAFKASSWGESCNQGAEIDDSIECYRQRLKRMRQKTREINAVEVAVAQRIHEETAAICSAQILEAKLQSKLPTDLESISTNEPQSDAESDGAEKSSDEHGDLTDEKALINHKVLNGDMRWPSPLAALPGVHFLMPPRVGPRGGAIVQARRPSLPNAAPSHTVGDLIASNSLYSRIHGAF